MVFGKFYEIQSLPFQDTEKAKCRGQINGEIDNVKTVYPPTNTDCRGYKYMYLPYQFH